MKFKTIKRLFKSKYKYCNCMPKHNSLGFGMKRNQLMTSHWSFWILNADDMYGVPQDSLKCAGPDYNFYLQSFFFFYSLATKKKTKKNTPFIIVVSIVIILIWLGQHNYWSKTSEANKIICSKLVTFRKRIAYM